MREQVHILVVPSELHAGSFIITAKLKHSKQLVPCNRQHMWTKEEIEEALIVKKDYL